jgi:hypothetical protein
MVMAAATAIQIRISLKPASCMSANQGQSLGLTMAPKSQKKENE